VSIVDRPGQVTAAGDPLLHRLQAQLPAMHGLVPRPAVLREVQGAARPGTRRTSAPRAAAAPAAHVGGLDGGDTQSRRWVVRDVQPDPKHGDSTSLTPDRTANKTDVRFAASLPIVPKVTDDQLAARRGEILAAARRAFARHGYEGATVKIMEAETGLSRGAIFHHFRDKEALFLALAEDDAARTAEVVERAGLVQVMRDLRDKDAGWLGVQLEVRRRLRTDPVFAASWAERQAAVDAATSNRLTRQRTAGAVRDDVPVALLVDFLHLVLDGLVSRMAAGMTPDHLDGVLDLVEDAVRTRTNVPRID